MAAMFFSSATDRLKKRKSMNKREPKSLGESLQILIRQMGLEPKLNQFKVVQQWPEIVGEKISSVATAERVVNKTLYVKVKNMTWRIELLFQKRNLLKRVEEIAGKGIITDIRFH